REGNARVSSNARSHRCEVAKGQRLKLGPGKRSKLGVTVDHQVIPVEPPSRDGDTSKEARQVLRVRAEVPLVRGRDLDLSAPSPHACHADGEDAVLSGNDGGAKRGEVKGYPDGIDDPG